MTITPTSTEPTPIHGDDTDEAPYLGVLPDDTSRPSAASTRPSRRTRPRNGSRLFPPETSAEHHALYRLYNAAGVLLYVGETNNPVERYVEHRETKEWWPEVARHSIEWSRKGREKVQEMEKAAIRDEWPLYNVAHQPRGDGTFMLPAYVVDQIHAAIGQAVSEVFSTATDEQVGTVCAFVADAFAPGSDGEWGEVGFSFGGSPQTHALDLDAVLDAMGPFRPDIENSMRDPKPRSRSASSCDAPSARRAGRCGGKLRRDGSCPRPERHIEESAPLTDPLDAVGGA